ncbi:hypothetical protein [Cryobacterium sp. N21]|uniref:hypothetical protein n=1 Tax=Cryobacterium sp. N21 TaxID=2048289 RepID=UPI000CE3F808|nr:hypothetical protein [Cryobacterium sp. N21]
MDIETLAVNEISTLVAMCPHLIQQITTNDKTPFTDGHIEIYSGLERSKDEWVGRVSVQVKGRSTPAKGRFKKSYPISRTDLLAYQADSGVLYFVVSIDRDTGERHPYYALLSPFRIEKILSDAAPTTKQISVPLKDFPTNQDEIERLLHFAHKTKEQRPSAGNVSSLFPQMKSLTVFSAQNLKLDVPVSLVTGETEVTVVLTTTEGLSLHLDGELQLFPPTYIPRSVDVKIECGGFLFDQVTVQTIDDETVEMKLADGLSLRFRKVSNVQSVQANFTLVDLLPERLKALSFFVALLDRHPLVVDGGAIPFEKVTGDDPELRRHLDYLCKLADLFKVLGVDAKLVNLSEIDQNQHRELQLVHSSLVNHKEFFAENGEPGWVVRQVGRWQLMLLVTRGSDPGSWRYIDPFAPESRHEFRAGRKRTDDDESEYIPSTMYEIVENGDLKSILNLWLERITEAYDVIADLPDTATMANLQVLSLISAADANEERRGEFLGAANALSEWLIATAGEEPHHLVNRWQILKRRGDLNSAHRSEIRDLKRLMSRSDLELAGQIEVACALLLDDHEDAKYCLELLKPEERDQLKTWPIWALREPAAETAFSAAG